MKKLLYLTIILLVLSLFVTSCDKQKNKEIDTPDDNISNIDDKANEESNELHIRFNYIEDGEKEKIITDEELSKKYNDIFEKLYSINESNDEIYYDEIYETVPEIVMSIENKKMNYILFEDHPHRNYEGEKRVINMTIYAGDGERGYLILDSSELYNEIEEFIENIRNWK